MSCFLLALIALFLAQPNRLEPGSEKAKAKYRHAGHIKLLQQETRHQGPLGWLPTSAPDPNPEPQHP